MTSPAFEHSVATGRAQFEAGQYFEAHESFEVGWRSTRGDEKRVLQGLVLWAASLFQQERGRGGGARRLLARALERLGEVDDGFQGLDVDALKTALIETWGQLEHGAPLTPKWPADVAPQPPLVELEHRAYCPSCGEPVLVVIAPEDAGGSISTEDCPVCCRPWVVHVSRAGGQVSVTLSKQ